MIFHRSLLTLAAVACFSACSDDDGITEPGSRVEIFEFDQRTFTSSLNLTLEIDRERIDSSNVSIYYNPSTEAATAWYPMPGAGSSGAYETRFFIYQSSTSPSTYTIGVRTINASGTAYASAVTFRKIRVVVTKASKITPLAALAAPATRVP